MDHTRPVEVSAREGEVLTMLGLRLTNAQIGHRLHVSVRTVEGHVSSLLRKYGVADRKALADLAGTTAGGTPPPVGKTSGLPRTRTSFVGRVAERDQVLTALARDRLVTLLGPGGVGKTRLAVVVAEAAAPSFPFGAVFVDLVPVGPGFVTQAVAAALDVTERPQQPLADAVVERLARGRSLVILDNCEHLLDAVAELAERILTACPGATILATSRERVGLQDEHTISVGPLPLGSQAELLFYDRVRGPLPGALPDRAIVADVCARLDGLPLAIELAAARWASLGGIGLLSALGDYLRLLAGSRGSAVRHRSLRAVIGWSHDLLNEEERTLFRRLAVFAGGFDLRAVEMVAAVGDRAAAADILGRLVDKSLIVHGQAEGGWRLLETIRAVAAEHLDNSGERDQTRRRHLEWSLLTASALENRLEDEGWSGDFDAVAGDLRAALAAAPPGPGPEPHRLARALARLSYARRFLMESFDRFLEAAERAPTPGQAARDLRDAADCGHTIYNAGQRVFDLLLSSAAQAHTSGDGNARAIALALAVVMTARHPGGFAIEVPHAGLLTMLTEAIKAGDPSDLLVAAHLKAAAAWTAGPRKFDPDPALAEAAVAAARRAGDPVLLSAALDAVAIAARAAGRRDKSYRISRERLSLLTAMPRHDPHAAPEILDTHQVTCEAALDIGDLRAAGSAARLAAADELVGDSYLSAANLITPLVLAGDFEEALDLAATAWNGWQRAGMPTMGSLSPCLGAIALIHGLRGDDHAARLWRARAIQVRGPVVLGHATFVTFVDIRLAVHTSRFDDIVPLLELGRADTTYWSSAYIRAAATELAVVAELPDAAERLAAAGISTQGNDWAAACLARARGRLHGDTAALETSAAAWQQLGSRFERACTLLLMPGKSAQGTSELAAMGVKMA
ncbi:ATP-binding protein [Streptosporangium sp. G11]|uniref:ATP-binding protein n=1 Tax=Streptosporangium sp. G11 TaxID=3436926 RepID=UPI003EC0934F